MMFAVVVAARLSRSLLAAAGHTVERTVTIEVDVAVLSILSSERHCLANATYETGVVIVVVTLVPGTFRYALQ